MLGASKLPAFLALPLVLVCAAWTLLFGQMESRSSLRLDSGEHIYKAACAACHGPDGAGTDKSIAGFEPPRTFPDFTKCDQTTPEANSAWKAVIVNGGGYRGFSHIMPSFGQALTSKQIDQVIAYMRGFCRQSGWPRGELNLPRAIVTEKAFPEDEVVISSALNAQGAPGIVSHIIHEQRFGKKNQIEVDVPLNFQDQNHTWYGGVGDTTLGLKRVMFSSLKNGSILSLQGSVIVPTGKQAARIWLGHHNFRNLCRVRPALSDQHLYPNAIWRGSSPSHGHRAAIHLFQYRRWPKFRWAAWAGSPLDSDDGIPGRRAI